jgi:hypothetical protein
MITSGVNVSFVVMKTKSPEQDLAIMAACNHSIIGYGTYGVWGPYCQEGIHLFTT